VADPRLPGQITQGQLLDALLPERALGLGQQRVAQAAVVVGACNSMFFALATGRDARSSSVRITISAPGVSYPFATSEYGTSLPFTEQIRLSWIRPPSMACTWWKSMSLLSVAAYRVTGMETSPKETAPLQIGRIILTSRSASSLGRP
jgi:hypothetical protein